MKKSSNYRTIYKRTRIINDYSWINFIITFIIIIIIIASNIVIITLIKFGETNYNTVEIHISIHRYTHPSIHLYTPRLRLHSTTNSQHLQGVLVGYIWEYILLYFKKSYATHIWLTYPILARIRFSLFDFFFERRKDF